MNKEVKVKAKGILESWKESLALYKDTRFWLVVLKTLKDIYTVFFKQFWWLILLYYGSYYVLENSMAKPPFEVNGWRIALSFITLLLTSLIFFMLLISVRSSLEKKDRHYYRHYGIYFPVFFIILFISWTIRYVIPLFFVTMWFESAHTHYLFLKTVTHFTTVLFSPFVLFYSFFYFDSHLKCSYVILRLWSAFKMLVYAYPFCFIQTLLISLFISLLMGFVNLVLGLIKFGNAFDSFFSFWATSGLLLLVPLFLGIFHPLYTKQVHDHYERYAV